MINTSILEEIVHNDKESDVIKDFAYEALYPDKVDRECIKEITKYFGYSKDDDYYSTLKTFLIRRLWNILKKSALLTPPPCFRQRTNRYLL